MEHIIVLPVDLLTEINDFLQSCTNETTSVFNVKPLPVGVNETLMQIAPLLQSLNASRAHAHTESGM